MFRGEIFLLNDTVSYFAKRLCRVLNDWVSQYTALTFAGRVCHFPGACARLASFRSEA